MTDDRAQRMRRRRQESEQSEPDREDQQSEPSQTSQPSEQAEQSEQSEPDETDEQSVKDEHEGVYVYLPPGQKKELGLVFNSVKATYERAFEDGFEKNRHYYPLVIEYGLERVDEADADELAEMLEELDY
ncbi:hypothetical protein G9464_20840 [Halostella sp. JP-L12]|uniref:hypothetical protein n=1 Tax=Halostella TaxID=1843185 RepID=UPI000EF7E8E4|nr:MULTISPECIES: hypothetical protein [Halostella]NHN50019.1 hypothetical protein [Halostella sp. JP-L12]